MLFSYVWHVSLYVRRKWKEFSRSAYLMCSPKIHHWMSYGFEMVFFKYHLGQNKGLSRSHELICLLRPWEDSDTIPNLDNSWSKQSLEENSQGIPWFFSLKCKSPKASERLMSKPKIPQPPEKVLPAVISLKAHFILLFSSLLRRVFI